MSFKAKDLSYEAKDPTFLRRLKSQYGGADSARHERPIPRPRRLQNNNDDDAPTYVDEDTNEVITKEEYEALVHSNEREEPEKKAEDPSDRTTAEPSKEGRDKTNTGTEGSKQKQKQNLAEIGGPKKRKQGKVVGEENAPDDSEQRQENSSSRKSKQKKKKIKLSFDEAED